MVAPSSEVSIPEFNTGGKYYWSFTQDRVIDGNLK